MRIFTQVTTPFALGGTHKPMATEAEPISTHEVLDVTLALFQNPITEHFHVAEMISGGFVGFSTESAAAALHECLDDLANADPGVVEQRIRAACARNARAQLVEADYFWSRFSMSERTRREPTDWESTHA